MDGWRKQVNTSECQITSWLRRLFLNLHYLPLSIELHRPTASGILYFLNQKQSISIRLELGHKALDITFVNVVAENHKEWRAS